jgi:hypothetical protein
MKDVTSFLLVFLIIFAALTLFSSTIVFIWIWPPVALPVLLAAFVVLLIEILIVKIFY